jgi:hypothetical protein
MVITLVAVPALIWFVRQVLEVLLRGMTAEGLCDALDSYHHA